MITLNALVLCAFVNIGAGQNTDVCSGENEDLSCVKTKDCPWFQKHLMIYKRIPKSSAEKEEKLAELKSKVCSKGKPRKVCCPEETPTTSTTTTTTTKTTTITTTTQTSKPTRSNLHNTSPSWLPSGRKGECGLDIYSEFIFGGNITKMGEHPWAVLVGKPSSTRNGRQIKWHCGGTLINRWYVVSAAHCSPSQIKMIRVGEWRVVDTSKPLRKKGLKFSSNQRCRRCSNFRLVNGTYDCIDTSSNQFLWPEDAATNAICAPPHQDIEVAEVIVHPNYNRLKSGLVINDIVLIKLQHPVQLSDYVQPACLPTRDSPDLLQDLGEQETPLKPVVIGWGKSYDEDYNETATVASAFQQKLELPLVKNRDCSDIWSEFFKRNLTGDIKVENFICAGGEKGKDSCSGDSGGPLVLRESDADPTYLVGVVSAGTSRCGIGAPAIFTRVTSAVSWILDNIN